MKTRRRRYGVQSGEDDTPKENYQKKPVKFLQEVDYKMQIDDG